MSRSTLPSAPTRSICVTTSVWSHGQQAVPAHLPRLQICRSFIADKEKTEVEQEDAQGTEKVKENGKESKKKALKGRPLQSRSEGEIPKSTRKRGETSEKRDTEVEIEEEGRCAGKSANRQTCCSHH